MDTKYVIVNSRATSIHEIVKDDVSPQLSLGFLIMPPVLFSMGSAPFIMTGTSGMTNGIMVASQNSVKPIIVASFTSIDQAAQTGIIMEKYPTTPNAHIKLPRVNDTKLPTINEL